MVGAIMLLMAAAAPGSAAPTAVSRELIALEKASWVAWQNHDGAYFDHFLSADHIEMGPQGPAPKAPVVNMISRGLCTVRSYDISDFKVAMFAPNVAVLTYRAAQDTSCGKFNVPSPTWATSLFVKRGGRWQNALYSHTAIPPELAGPKK